MTRTKTSNPFRRYLVTAGVTLLAATIAGLIGGFAYWAVNLPAAATPVKKHHKPAYGASFHKIYDNGNYSYVKIITVRYRGVNIPCIDYESGQGDSPGVGLSCDWPAYGVLRAKTNEHK